MNWRIITGALLALAASTQCGFAADPRFPDWPCTQAKVPEISVAAVWAGPSLDDVQDKWKDDVRISALVAKLAARRIPLEEAGKDIKDFLAGSSDKVTSGKLLFSGLFDTLNSQRSSVMTGHRAGDPQTARRRGEDSLRYDRPPEAAGRIPARSIQNRRIEQSAALGSADIRGPATHGKVRLRGAHRDRPATIRARPRDPAGNGVAPAAIA